MEINGYAYSDHNVFDSITFKNTLDLETRFGCSEKAFTFHYCYPLGDADAAG